jgi:hypothetical protein
VELNRCGIHNWWCVCYTATRRFSRRPSSAEIRRELFAIAEQFERLADWAEGQSKIAAKLDTLTIISPQNRSRNHPYRVSAETTTVTSTRGVGTNIVFVGRSVLGSDGYAGGRSPYSRRFGAPNLPRFRSRAALRAHPSGAASEYKTAVRSAVYSTR